VGLIKVAEGLENLLRHSV